MAYARQAALETAAGATPPDFNTAALRDASANLAAMPPIDRLRWASDTFGSGLYATTSAGRDAALLWDMMARSDEPVGLTFANTGFLHPDTIAFRDTLTGRYPELDFYQCGPTEEQRAAVAEEKLWRDDPDRFMDIVKLDPLERLSQGLGVTALMSAIHWDQTPNRAGLDFVTRRPDGTYRIHPFLDWTKEQVRAYIDEQQLPSNPLPLLAEGVEHRRIVYLDGVVELIPISECGLHVVDGRLVRKNTSS